MGLQDLSQSVRICVLILQNKGQVSNQPYRPGRDAVSPSFCCREGEICPSPGEDSKGFGIPRHRSRGCLVEPCRAHFTAEMTDWIRPNSSIHTVCLRSMHYTCYASVHIIDSCSEMLQSLLSGRCGTKDTVDLHNVIAGHCRIHKRV